MQWCTATATHIGGRDEQQDRSAVIRSPNGGALLIVIADGMGGLKDGGKAAQAVIEASHTIFDGSTESDPLECLNQIIDHAHRAINEFDGDQDKAPGSTCVLLLLKGERAYWAHVGDSRLYHFRNFKLLERTSDHSVAQILIEQGQLNECEAAKSPFQNQLYKRLGGNNTPDPDFSSRDLQDGDAFLLCSDGFWETVYPEQVIETVTERSLADSVDFLIELAAKQGGADGDNVSLTLVVVEKPEKSSIPAWANNILLWLRSRLA